MPAFDAFIPGLGSGGRACTRSIRCSGRGIATRRGSRWRNSAFRTTIVDLDILKGDARTPQFLAMNPSGRVPVLEVAPGRYLAESNAILWYIAGGTPLAPEDRIDRTSALQWMFFEQNSLEPYLGAAFFWLTLVKGGRELQVHALEDWMEKGYQAFSVMEKHLAAHDFFAAGHYTIADIALYGYTHLAHECDFDLDGISRDPRLAQPRRRSAGPCADGLASGDRRGRRMSFIDVPAGKIAAIVTSLADGRARAAVAAGAERHDLSSSTSSGPTSRGFARCSGASARAGSGSRAWRCRTPSSRPSSTIRRSRCSS